VFTARCAQFPYITQIRFVFKRLITYYLGSGVIVVTIVTRLRVGGFRVQIPAGTSVFSLLQNVHAGPGSQPGSLGSSDRSVGLTTHILLVSRLRVSGAEVNLRWVKICTYI
jgi:hypothetical protein